MRYTTQELEKALYDVYSILGFDTDGDSAETFARALTNMPDIVVSAAVEFRNDYDDLLEELED